MKNISRFRNTNAVMIAISTILAIIATIATIGHNTVVKSFVIVPTVPLSSRTTTTTKTTTTTQYMINRMQSNSDNIDRDDVPANHDVVPRRAIVSMMMGTILGGTAMTVRPRVVSATYSAYARREEDWQQRVSQNAVQVSTPKLLRDQLREIAPMNEERSRIFCPNGPSAAVTPLMENRCSDVRQATPSVFGRTQDVVGNSIPGFSEEWTSSIYSSNLPEYGFTKGRK